MKPDELSRAYDALKAAKDHDLLEARRLQMSLVPVPHRDFGTCRVTRLLRPSNLVGGDLVGFYRAGQNHVGFFALDVSGHGVSSALMAARLAGFLLPDGFSLFTSEDRELSVAEPMHPSKIVEALNTRVMTDIQSEHYLTMILGDIDLRSGFVRLCQAGHPHPLIQRADGSIDQSGPGGFPVGLMDNVEFATFDIQLSPGERMILPSDGVTECENRDGVPLGEEGLAQIAEDLEDLTGTTFTESFMWRISEYAEKTKIDDDVSLLLLDYRGS